MTDPYVQQPLNPTPQPSWLRPIVLGALFAILMAMTMPLVASVAPGIAAQVIGCCCTSLLFIPQGFLPAWLAFRQDAYTTPGNGFVVSFIAVGFALIVTTALFWVSYDASECEQELREVIRQIPAIVEGMPSEEVERMISLGADNLPLSVLMLSAFSAVLAGFAGLITVLVLRRPPRRMQSYYDSSSSS